MPESAIQSYLDRSNTSELNCKLNQVEQNDYITVQETVFEKSTTWTALKESIEPKFLLSFEKVKVLGYGF
jgi:hypothetical protein